MRVNPLVSLHWHAWGDEITVFDALSGEMSLLSPMDGAVFACVEQGFRDLASVVAAVGADLGLDASDSTLQTEVRASVDQFLAKGWLEAIPFSA